MDPVTGLKHLRLSVPCEPPDGSHCDGQRIMSTWLDADYKYMCVTTCTECDAPASALDAPAPDEPFAD